MAVPLTPSFDSTRAQWRGRRAATPANLQEGDWWYRTDLNCFCYWDGSSVQCWGGMGGMMFRGTNTIVCAAAGDYVMNVTISTPWNPVAMSDLINITFDTDPVCDPGTPTNVIFDAPVVGFTIVGVGAGTTLSALVNVTGW